MSDRGRHPFGPQDRHATQEQRRAEPDHLPPALHHVRVSQIEPHPLYTGVGVVDRGEGQDSLVLHDPLGRAAPPNRAADMVRRRSEPEVRPSARPSAGWSRTFTESLRNSTGSGTLSTTLQYFSRCSTTRGEPGDGSWNQSTGNGSNWRRRTEPADKSSAGEPQQRLGGNREFASSAGDVAQCPRIDVELAVPTFADTSLMMRRRS